MNSLYIHIGLHKTGTTTLQNGIFPYLCYSQYIPRDKIKRFIAEIAFNEPEVFRKKNVNVPGILQKHEKILISDENLSGSPTLGYINRLNSIKNIKSIFPDAKIIVGLREQTQILRSCYKNYIKQGGTKRIEDIMTEGPDKNTGLNFINIDSFKYSFFLSELYNFCRTDEVFVYFNEDLRNNFDLFISKFSGFINDEIRLPTNIKSAYNIGFSEHFLFFLLYINKYRKSSFNRGIPIPSRLLRLMNSCFPKNKNEYFDYFDKLKSYYSHDNMLLSKMINRDLPSNYFCFITYTIYH